MEDDGRSLQIENDRKKIGISVFFIQHQNELRFQKNERTLIMEEFIIIIFVAICRMFLHLLHKHTPYVIFCSFLWHLLLPCGLVCKV